MLGVQVTVSSDSVTHQLYGNNNHCMQVHSAGVQYMRDHPERFVKSNTENSWLRYLNNMCVQGIWPDALIVHSPSFLNRYVDDTFTTFHNKDRAVSICF